MADDGQFSDDISALWGDPEEGALVPPRAETPPEPVPVATNGSRPEPLDDDPAESVARLAQAIATHRTDVVSKAELELVRSEMEGAFTHQLAVALYDLLGATNDRFARTERRLDELARRLEESVAGHFGNIEELLMSQRRAAAADQKDIQAQLDVLYDHQSRRLDLPLDQLAAFQRDVRHEIGRIADAVVADGAGSGRRADHDAAARRELTERVDGAAAEGSAKIDDLSARITAVQDDVLALREAMTELRQTLGGSRWRRRRQGRAG